jgi:hypothetical protein
LFDQTAPDYSDFELPEVCQNDLIIKILKYAGVSIREQEIVQVASNEEANKNAQQ